jgi:DNA-binding MarR family transcriptional regulator
MPPRNRKSATVTTAETAPESSISLGGLEGFLGYHMRRAQDSVHRDFIDTLAALDITQKQAATLFIANANPGVSQIDIANELHMDRATMTIILDKLEARDLIQRKRSQIDRRRQLLYLTPRGQKTLIAVKAKILQHEKRFRQRLSESEQAMLIDLLGRFYEG